VEIVGLPPTAGTRLTEGQSWAIALPPKAVEDNLGFGWVVDKLQLAACGIFLKTYKYQLLKIFR
jgi:hypothetical protein